MHKDTRYGFTIVELLVVVLIIAVIATLSTMSYGAMQKRSLNIAQLEDMNQVSKAMETYRAKNGYWPPATASADGGYCLGVGYPSGRCRDHAAAFPNSYAESDRTITDALATVTTMPNKQRTIVNGTTGPYMQVFSENQYRLVGVLRAETCPKPYVVEWNDPSSDKILCYIDFT